MTKFISYSLMNKYHKVFFDTLCIKNKRIRTILLIP